MSITDIDHLGFQPGYDGKTTGLFSNFSASFEKASKVDSLMGFEYELQERYKEVLNKYLRLPNLSEADRQAVQVSPVDIAGYLLDSGYVTESAIVNNQPSAKREQIKARYDRINAQLAQLNDPSLPTFEQILKEVIEYRQKVSETEKDVTERAGVLGTIGAFLGGAAGQFTYRDPLQLGTLPIGGAGRTVAARLASEAAIAAGIEAGQQNLVNVTREQLGEPEVNVWQSAGLAAGGAVALGGLVEGGAALLRGRAARRAAEAPIAQVSDEALEQTLRRVDTPSSRAGLFALETQRNIERISPYPPTTAGMRRFTEELSEVVSILSGKTDTAIARALPPGPPLELEQLDFQTLLVKETAPEVYERYLAAKTRLEEVSTTVETRRAQVDAVDIADAVDRIDPDSGALVRSYLEDLDNPSLSRAQRAQLEGRVNQILESLGVDNVQRELDNARIGPRQELKTARASEKAAKREYNQARNALDAEIDKAMHQQQVRERINQLQAVPDLVELVRNPNLPVYGQLLRPDVVNATIEAVDQAATQISREVPPVRVADDGTVEVGPGEAVPADLEVDFEVNGVVQTMTAREIAEDLAEDERLVQAMGVCSL
jgi:hypothetical protein